MWPFKKKQNVYRNTNRTFDRNSYGYMPKEDDEVEGVINTTLILLGNKKYCIICKKTHQYDNHVFCAKIMQIITDISILKSKIEMSQVDSVRQFKKFCKKNIEYFDMEDLRDYELVEKYIDVAEDNKNLLNKKQMIEACKEFIIKVLDKAKE